MSRLSRFRLLLFALLLTGTALPVPSLRAAEAPAASPVGSPVSTACLPGESAGANGTSIEATPLELATTPATATSAAGPAAATPTTMLPATIAGHVICLDLAARPVTLTQSAYATTIIVASGELTVTYIGPYLEVTPDTVPVAVYYAGSQPDQAVVLADGQQQSMRPGDMLVIGSAEVELDVAPASSGPARVVVLGIVDETTGECPAACVKWPPR